MGPVERHIAAAEENHRAANGGDMFVTNSEVAVHLLYAIYHQNMALLAAQGFTVKDPGDTL